MSKKLLLAICLFPIYAIAQPPKDEYEVIQNEDPLKASYGQKFPGYYITKAGDKTDCLILFEEGGKMSSTNTELKISKTYAGNFESVDKGNLVAFFVNDRLYKKAKVDGSKKWVNFASQGAISNIKDAIYFPAKVDKKLEFWYDKEKQANVAYMDTLSFTPPWWGEAKYVVKLDQPAESFLIPNPKNVLPFVEDNKELAEKINNKEKGYKPSLVAKATGEGNFADRMFKEYNAWYDKNNPGAITYYSTSASYIAPDAPADVAQASPEVSSITEQDPFAGRPTSPGPDIATSKGNIPVKKESFTDKLARYKNEGFKVALVLSSGKITTKPAGTIGTSTTMTQKELKGSLPSMKTDFESLAKGLTAKLNEAFATDLIELVDMKKIPFKESKLLGKVNNWEGTIYKLIINYTIQPEYDYNFSMNKYNGDFVVSMNIVGTEFVNEKKGVKMRYPLRAGNLGYYKKAYASEKDPGVTTVVELNELVAPPSGEELVAELQKQQDKNLPKIIEKLKK